MITFECTFGPIHKKPSMPLVLRLEKFRVTCSVGHIPIFYINSFSRLTLVSWLLWRMEVKPLWSSIMWTTHTSNLTVIREAWVFAVSFDLAYVYMYINFWMSLSIVCKFSQRSVFHLVKKKTRPMCWEFYTIFTSIGQD